MADPIAMSFNASNLGESSSKGAIRHPNVMEDHGNWDDEGGESEDYDDEKLDERDDYDDEGLDDSSDELDTLVSSAKRKGKGREGEKSSIYKLYELFTTQRVSQNVR